MNIEKQQQSWLSRLKNGLQKSTSKISTGIADIFTKSKLSDHSLEELEELMIQADMGVETAGYIAQTLAQNRFDKNISPAEIRQALATIIADILRPVALPLDISKHCPEVILVCGVNGNGKTTTIGKLAAHYQSQGNKVMLAACDTFRAAASSQLQIWAERSKALLITGQEQADPASVAYNAMQEAKSKQVDLLLLDTAGRLQNKSNLMDELAKIVRIIKKVDDNAPHHTLLVLDATTGQNAHLQVESFKAIANITGLIITKLDGTAKAGVVVALARKYALPIYAIGVGEQLDDLQAFDADNFARNLVGL